MKFRKHLEQYNPNKPDANHRRKRTAYAVFSYIEQDTHHEYRKAFTAPANTPEREFWQIAPETIE